MRFAMQVADADVNFSHSGYGSKGLDGIGERFESLNPQFFGQRNIFLHRNPLDVAVSMFHQIHNRNFAPSAPQYDEIRQKLVKLDRLPPAEIDDFVLHPVWGCRNIAAYNQAHLDHFSGRDDAIAVRYEDLRADPHTHFSRMLDFSGLKRYDIARVVEESSFDRMRALELDADKSERRTHKLYGLKNGNENTLKVRKGEVRGYVNALRPETIEQAARICAALDQEI